MAITSFKFESLPPSTCVIKTICMVIATTIQMILLAISIDDLRILHGANYILDQIFNYEMSIW